MIQVAVMGYGTIGSGVVEVLETNKDKITEKTGKEIAVKYILDLREFPGDPHEAQIVHDFEIIEKDEDVEIVVEAMGGVNPAYKFAKACLLAGKHVVTSNKALVAAHGTELLAIAREKNLNFLFEASVGGGIPLLRPLTQSLAGEKIEEISGILNGTTNYILTKMAREGQTFEEALKKAQELGYAERNPEADVEGYDTCRKITILTSGWNGVTDLKLSCGDIQILSGSVKVTGGNIGYGELWPLDGNGMEGGSVTISEEVQLELPLESKIAPRGEECTYGKKTFQITAYDNQLQNETYQADIALYWKNDTERKNPVYEKSTQMTVSGFRGTIPDITQWMGYSGNMQMVVALEPSGGGTVKTMEGSVVLNKGKDETISVTLGKAAYQKAMDLTIHDGRLRDGKKYTLTVCLCVIKK